MHDATMSCVYMRSCPRTRNPQGHRGDTIQGEVGLDLYAAGCFETCQVPVHRRVIVLYTVYLDSVVQYRTILTQTPILLIISLANTLYSTLARARISLAAAVGKPSLEEVNIVKFVLFETSDWIRVQTHDCSFWKP